MSTSYRQILKSTTLVGGGQVVDILIGIVRTKVLAVLLGPSGMGLAGLFYTATGLIASLSGLGIGSSGVREIADAAGSDDPSRIARTLCVLRRTAFVTGLAGMLVTLAISGPLARFTFGEDGHTWEMALMSLTLLFGGVSRGRYAVMQGLRRLRDLVTSQALGNLLGSTASIALVYYLGKQGVAPFLVAISGFGVLLSWWYARRVPIRPARMSWKATFEEARGLVGLGAAFMVSSLLTAGVAYGARILIQRELSMDAVGLYQATVTISSIYVGFVLGAMGADFFPRLTAIADDNREVNRLVNEQTEIGLLIAFPGVLATMVLAPWVLSTFYSPEFTAAAGIIRWQIVGVALRVVSFPIVYIVLAKGRSRLYVGTEVVTAGAHVLLILLGMNALGLEGIGVAYAVLYVGYTAMMLAVGARLSGLAWSQANVLSAGLGTAVLVAVLALVKLAPVRWAVGAGLVATAIVSVFCLRRLERLIGTSLIALVRDRLTR